MLGVLPGHFVVDAGTLEQSSRARARDKRNVAVSLPALILDSQIVCLLLHLRCVVTCPRMLLLPVFDLPSTAAA